MRIFLGLLPFLSLAFGFVILYGWLVERKKLQPLTDRAEPCSRIDALIYAVVIWGSYVVIISEGLGRFKAISFQSLFLGWLLPLLVLLAVGFNSGKLKTGWTLIVSDWHTAQFTRFEKSLVTAMAVWMAVLLVIALISPPNTTDSLDYHMPRVAHWSQNGSLAHYPTAYEFQLYNSIWAELVILQSYVLAGSDKLANLVQWLSMIGSVCLGMTLAGRLGAKRLGQISAGIIVMTIPMGILQSTSTQNDYVVSFWIMALAYLTIRTHESKVGYKQAFLIGSAIGLGMLTKGTYYPIALPFLLWMFVPFLWQVGFSKTIRISLLVASVALLMNVAFWSRNYTTFNSIIGPAWWVEEKSMGSISPQAILVNTIRQLSVHLGTPFPDINDRLGAGVVSLCEWLQQGNCVNLNDSDQYRYRIPLISNHEDSTGNLLHLVLAGFVMCLALMNLRKLSSKVIIFTLALSSAYLVFCAVILWELFGSRYQLPFFVLAGPFCAVTLDKLVSKKVMSSLMIVLLVAGLPWLIFNRTRPLIGIPPRVTLVGSIFTTNRTDLLLANHDWLREPIISIGNVYRTISCNQVGLWIDSRDPEYVFWVVLGAQERGLRLESLYFDPGLKRYADPDFTPCAIICSICGGKAEMEGLPLIFRDHGFDLYLSSEYKFP